MRHTARSQFVEAALPAFNTFVSYYNNREIGLRCDTRNAAAVAEALRDLPEHVCLDPVAGPLVGHHGPAKKYREAIRSTVLAYNIVCDVADAWKHHTLNRPGRTISSLEAVGEFQGLVQYRDEEGTYYSSRKLLTVTCIGGMEYHLANLLEVSLRSWTDELIRLGVIPNAPVFPALLPAFISREDAGQLPKMRVRGQSEESFELGHKKLIFRPEEDSLSLQLPGEGFYCSVDFDFEVLESPVGKKDGQ